MTDKELRDAAVVELKKTTQGYLKSNGQPRALVGAQWKKGLDLLAQIGVVVEPPPPPPPPPPASSHPLIGSQVTLDPGEIAAWNIFDSPTTQVVGNVGDRYSRIVRWDTSGLYKTPQRSYSLHGFKLVSGTPGRMFDWHTCPYDLPWKWVPPAYPGGPGTAVAPLAIDYFGSHGLEIVVEPNDWPSGSGDYHFQIMSPAEIEARRNQWVWLWVETVWARRGMATPGSCRVWVAGEDAPRVDKQGINTHWYEEHFVTFWEGSYHGNGASTKCVTQLAATRFGRTPRECFEDMPVLVSRRPAGTPGGEAVGIAPVEGGNVPVPAALRWA